MTPEQEKKWQEEINQLREELKRERNRVDDFILMNDHADFCRYKYGEECSEQCMSSYYHLHNQLKFAKQVQNERKVEL